VQDRVFATRCGGPSESDAGRAEVNADELASGIAVMLASMDAGHGQVSVRCVHGLVTQVRAAPGTERRLDADDRRAVVWDPWPPAEAESLLPELFAALARLHVRAADEPVEPAGPSWIQRWLVWLEQPPPGGWPDPGAAASADVRQVTLADLESSDLYDWFNLAETGRSAAGPDAICVRLAPGMSGEHIEMAVTIDGSGAVVGASLGLDRAWLDGSTIALADGGDLAKSLLAQLAPADPILGDLSRQLEAEVARRAGTMTASSYDPPTLDRVLLTFLILFLTPADGHTSIEGIRELRAANVARPGGLWFHLAWGEAALPASS
jgi:hypothetical protein